MSTESPRHFDKPALFLNEIDCRIPYPKLIPLEILAHAKPEEIIKDCGNECTADSYRSILGVNTNEVRGHARKGALYIGSRARLLALNLWEGRNKTKANPEIYRFLSVAHVLSANIQGLKSQTDLDIFEIERPNYKDYEKSRTTRNGYKKNTLSEDGIPIQHLAFPRASTFHPAFEWTIYHAMSQSDAIVAIPKIDGTVISCDLTGALSTDPSLSFVPYLSEKQIIIPQNPFRSIRNCILLAGNTTISDVNWDLKEYISGLKSILERPIAFTKDSLQSINGLIESCSKKFCPGPGDTEFFKEKVKTVLGTRAEEFSLP